MPPPGVPIFAAGEGGINCTLATPDRIVVDIQMAMTPDGVGGGSTTCYGTATCEGFGDTNITAREPGENCAAALVDGFDYVGAAIFTVGSNGAPPRCW